MSPEKCFSCQSETDDRAKEYSGEIYCPKCLSDPFFLESLQEGDLKDNKNEAVERGTHSDKVLGKWRQKKGVSSPNKRPKKPKKDNPRKPEKDDNDLLSSDGAEYELFNLLGVESIREALENFLGVNHRINKVFEIVEGRGLPKTESRFLQQYYPELMSKPSDVINYPIMASHLFETLGHADFKVVYRENYERICELLQIKKR